MTMASNDTILMKYFIFNLINSMHIATLVLSELRQNTYLDFFYCQLLMNIVSSTSCTIIITNIENAAYKSVSYDLSTFLPCSKDALRVDLFSRERQ